MNTIFRDTLKEENNMSAIIAACGVKFCAFIADLRVVTFDENDNPKFANDHTQKISNLMTIFFLEQLDDLMVVKDSFRL